VLSKRLSGAAVLRGHTQRPQKLNVWADFYDNQVVGPFFINENLNSETYLQLLTDLIVPSIQEIVGDNFDDVWFQQDGALPHYGRIVRNYLNDTFPNRWISRRGTIELPPRLPDIAPLDFFL